MAQKQDIESVRRNVDKLFRTAVLDLREAYSSDREIKREMHEAVDRIMKEDETEGD
jgi:hypothetical protein